MATDFAHIEEKTKSFKFCSEINKFDLDFEFEKWKENADLEKVKEQFIMLGKWDSQINKNIRPEEKKGLIVASGRKIKEKL